MWIDKLAWICLPHSDLGSSPVMVCFMASPYGLLKIDILVCDVLLVTSDDLHYIFMLQINRQ